MLLVYIYDIMIQEEGMNYNFFNDQQSHYTQGLYLTFYQV